MERSIANRICWRLCRWLGFCGRGWLCRYRLLFYGLGNLILHDVPNMLQDRRSDQVRGMEHQLPLGRFQTRLTSALSEWLAFRDVGCGMFDRTNAAGNCRLPSGIGRPHQTALNQSSTFRGNLSTGSEKA